MSDTAEAIAPDNTDIAPVDDLAAAIGAAFDQAEASATQDEGQARDERGRFVAAQTDEAPEPEAEAPDEQPQAEADEAPEEARPEVPPVAASALDKIAEEYQPYYASAGLNAEQATRMLFEAHKGLLRDPEAGIRALMTQYGVDPAKFAPRPQPAPAEAPATTDPTMTAVMQRMAALEQFLQTQQQQAQAAEAQRVEQSIQAFAADPKHPHFPAVRSAMGALMQAGVAKDMDSAYDMACRAHPEVWAQIQAAEAASKAKAEATKRAQVAAAARTKAPVVRTNVPAPGSIAPPDDLGAMIEAAWEGRLN